MNPIATDTAASAAALLAVVEQLVRDTHHGEPSRAALDSSLERDLGLDSLARVELVLRVERAFAVSLPEHALYTAETPRDLLRLVHGSQGVRRAAPGKSVQSLVQAESGAANCEAQTLTAALAWHAATHPERLQVHLYTEGAEEEISYAALYRGAAACASRLAALGLQPGQTVAIMLPTGRDYLYSFFGIVMAGGIPVPLYPPARPAQIEEHLRRHVGILDNCRASMLITVPAAKAVALLLRAQVQSLQQVLMPDDLAGGDEGFKPFPAKPGDIAFLQYTSGSTGNPKGVVLTHANLVANIRAMAAAVRANADDVFVSWLPLYHDMGLIGAWFAALYVGFPTVLMSPLAFLSHPSRWLWAIHRHRGTLSGGPNFSYELCLKRIAEAELEGLDLSCWRYAFNGAEPVSPDTLAGFEQRFARYGLRPGVLQPVYGLAESSVGLAFPPPGTHYRIDRIERAAFQNEGIARPAAADANALCVPCCGRVLPEHQLRVVDALGVELPERREGRLQFRGPSATSGYFRNPEQTAKLYADDWLDSGDLAYLADGELYLSGRSKDIIIRGGRNLYPYELEQAVGALPGIRKGCVAVFGSIDPANGTERVIVLAETRETATDKLAALRRGINERAVDLIGLPADDVVLAPPHTVLKTSSGKIRRAASREYYESGGSAARAAPVWLQLARVARASLAPELRRRARALAGLAYSLWVWFCFFLLALPTLAAAALLPRNPARGWRFSRAIARGFLRLCRLPLVVQGAEHLPAAGAFVIAANHASYLDGLILVAALRERGYRFAAKRELRDSPIARVFLGSIGTEFVERADVRQGVEDASRLEAAVRAGRAPIFFAEGTFTRNAGLLPFRMGAFVIAAQTGAPLVPVALRGTRSVLRDGSWFVRRGAMVVTIGPALAPQGGDWNAAIRLRDAARAEILRHCGEPDLAPPPL